MRVTINKGFISQKKGKTISIFDGEKSVLHTLNETASFIFEMLKKGKSKTEIIDLALKKYDTDKKVFEKDLDETVKDLASKKIVKLIP